MKIGVIIAMDKEFRRVRAMLDGAEERVCGGRTYVSGTMGPNTVVMHQCGIGKVNAAIGATEMISRFAPDVVVSTGVAGGASVELEVQDVVMARQTCFHDVYCGPESAAGQMIGEPERFDTDKALIERALAIPIINTRARVGLTVTGDWFVDTPEKMRAILDAFPDALAVDMESAAIAQVCRQRGVGFLSFRIVSDIPLSGDNTSQYEGFWDDMADRSFGVTRALLEGLA